ncbi:MAG: hypothetical protein ACOYT8_01150 [Candidatus Dependentiae bacterium]
MIFIYVLLVLMSLFDINAAELPFESEQPIIATLSDKVVQQQLIKQIVDNSSNVIGAIQKFKDFFVSALNLSSKQMDVKALVFNFLNALSAKYPNQEVRIALLLDVPLADEWLRIKKPTYSPKKYDVGTAQQAVQFIMTKNYDKLKQWLDEGNQPDRVLKAALIFKNLTALKMAIAYGAQINRAKLFMSEKVLGTPLDYINAEIKKNNQLIESNKLGIDPALLDALKNYLVEQGAVSSKDLYQE